MTRSFRRFRRLLFLLFLLAPCLAPALAQAQTLAQTQSAAGTHLTFTPAPIPTATRLVFTPLSASLSTLAAQVTAAIQQITDLKTQNAALKSQLSGHALAATIPFGSAYTNTTGRLAVAHYQASCRAWGNGSVAGCVAEIAKARAMGFDAFSIDLNAYTDNYPYNVDNLYTAANQGNAINKGAVNDKGVGDFHLFITLDMATFPYSQSAILPVLSKYLKDPANLVYRGKPLYSTYTGGRHGTQADLKAFWQGINANLAAQNIAPCFIPGFETSDTTGGGSESPALYAAFLKTFADGWWQYPNTDTPLQPYDSSLTGDEARSAAARAAGLIVMTGQMGGQWGSGHSQSRDGVPRFYNEYYGGEGVAAYWRSINVFQQPDIAQYCTFNDYDEASNLDDHDVGPGSEWPYLTHSFVPGFYLSKAGLVNEWQYGLQEFKTGVPPKITSSYVNVFYRPQTAAVTLNTASSGSLIDTLGPIARLNDETGGFDITGGAGIADIACITCDVPRVSVLTWAVGSVYARRLVPAGVTHLRLPFVAGQPSLTLTDQSGTNITVPGLLAIVDHADYLNCNIFSATAHN